MNSLADSENWNFVNNVKLALTIVLLKVRKEMYKKLSCRKEAARCFVSV